MSGAFPFPEIPRPAAPLYPSGIPQGILPPGLAPVPEQLGHCPVLSMVDDPRIVELLPQLTEDNLAHLDFEGLCKVRLSHRGPMSPSVENLFASRPELALVNRISRSAWQWGKTMAPWNEVVDTYEGIRNFSMEVDGLDVAVDHAADILPSGWSGHARVFLDGGLAFLVQQDGRHVMTVGFSVMAGHRLLLQQVQLASPRGNRWLFGLPCGRLEHIIGRMLDAFPEHDVHVIDGGDAARSSLQAYTRGIAENERVLFHLPQGSLCPQAVEAREAVASLRRRHAHLVGDVSRIEEFYRDTGRFEFEDRGVEVNGVRHYLIQR